MRGCVENEKEFCTQIVDFLEWNGIPKWNFLESECKFYTYTYVCICLLRNLCQIVTDNQSLKMFLEKGNYFLASLVSFRPNKILTLWPGFGVACGYC